MKNERIFSNFLWRFAERSGAQCVKLLVELVLARLLLPEDYGSVALVAVFITILNVFVESGLASALIQKKDADDIDFSSVFYFNIVWCCVLYCLLFASAPFISAFYSRPELTAMIRVLGLSVIISGVKNVQQAFVSRNMQFKRFFFATLGGTLGAAVLGILMAYLGFGVWALIAQQLFNTAVDTLILWLTVKWRPKKVFSIHRLRSLLNYGWKLLLSSLLDTVYTNIRSLLIGKIYTTSELAFYNQGEKYPNAVVGNINTSIDSVLLPTMSNEQDNAVRVKEMTRRAIKTSTYIMAPLMMGLAATANNLVYIVLTAKWLPCVFYLRIFCITYMFYPIHTANLNAIKALGRSDMFLKLEIIKKVVGLVLLALTVGISVEAMAYSLLLSSVLCQMINAWPNRKLLNYGYWEQLKDILPNIVLATVMGILVHCVEFLGWSAVPTLCVQVLLGAILYVAGSMITKNDSFQYLWEIVKPMGQKIIPKK
ncbi:MAG: lipopolysaccharide biosynthesis protein [Faecousia sp.]